MEDFFGDGWCSAVPPADQLDIETYENLMLNLKQHTAEARTPHRMVCVPLSETVDMDLLVRHNDAFHTAGERLMNGLMQMGISPTEYDKRYRDFTFAVEPLMAAFEAVHYLGLAEDHHVRPWIRVAQEAWTEMKPIVADKDNKQKADWLLLLQHKIGVIGFRRGWKLHNGILVEPVQGTKRAVRPVGKILWEGGDEVKESLEEAVWKYVIEGMNDAEMMRALRQNTTLVSKACQFFYCYNSEQIPHILPTMSYISFHGGLLLETIDPRGRMSLRVVNENDLSPDRVCRVHHDHQLDEEWLTRPMAPCWEEEVTQKYTKRTADDEEKEEERIVRQERTGSRLLEWLRAPVSREDFEAVKFIASDQEGYVVQDASVAWDVVGRHTLTPQDMYLFFALIGRCMYLNNKFDKWECAMYVRGASRAGKGVMVYRLLQQLLGSDALGMVGATRMDSFAYAGANNWRVLMITELRDGIKIPEADMLQMISGEDIILRASRENPVKIAAQWQTVMTGNGDSPFNSKASEFDNRLIEFNFDQTSAGNEDTTLNARREAQVGAILVMALRCYQTLKRALGKESIHKYLPANIRRVREMAEWHANRIYQFLNSDWCHQSNMSITYLSQPQNHAAFLSSQISELGKYYLRWAKASNIHDAPEWTPSTTRPVFKHMHLPFNTTGLEVDGINTNPDYSLMCGHVYGIALTAHALEEMRRYEGVKN